MKTFNEFITEAQQSRAQMALRTAGRLAKFTGRQIERVANTEPVQTAVKAGKKYVINTALGAAGGIALKLLTGL